MLSLAAVQQPCTTSQGATDQYASGPVNTHSSYTFTYGYVEASIYVPADSSGTPTNFPAFWAVGTGTWPSTGELDVMEVLHSCGPGVGYHFQSDAGNPGWCPTLPAPSGWHSFGAEWAPGVVTYYVDGRQVGQITSGITNSPMYLILDNCVDPTCGGSVLTPASMLVDYKRVCSDAS